MKRYAARLATRFTYTALALLVMVVFCLAPAVPVFADLSKDDVDAVYNNWPGWVAGDDINCAAATSDTVLSGDGPIAQAFNFFVSKGLTAAQSAGIVGNLRQESGVNAGSNNTAAKGGGGGIIPGVTQGGGGIAQWEGGRWSGPSGLLNFVAGKGDFNGKPQGDGKNWKDLKIQLDFMWGELTGIFPSNKQPGLKETKAALNPEQAAIAFEKAYERAGIPNMPNRIRYANEVFAAYGSKVPVTPPADGSTTLPTAPPVDSTGCPVTGGTASINVDGYAWPINRKDYPARLCSAKTSTYTDKYGHSTAGSYCHHDGTPAFDLMDGDGGSAVYAITNGKIANTTSCYSLDGGPCVQGCSTIQFQAANGNDKSYYWYGHLMSVSVKAGQTVTAGQQMATTATRKFGASCWGGGPHEHIDRGCKDNSGTPQHGGNKGCRDPQFMIDLQKIWEGVKK